MYTQLGVLTKGTIIEVNVSELGLVTAGGKVVWGRYAQLLEKIAFDGVNWSSEYSIPKALRRLRA